VGEAFHNDNQVITGNYHEPNCCATSVHMRNPYSHAASKIEGVDANILMNEYITENSKYSSFYKIRAYATIM